MTIGQNFYGDQGLTDIEDLSRRQGKQSLLYGDQAARYADPFMGERGKYQKQLSDLLADPGGYASSPVYKFAYDQGLEALNRKGSLRSGNKLAALEKYGQDMASQQYFPQAKLLSDLAVGGSSPGAAGLAYARGTERSQDQAQMSAAASAAKGYGGSSGGGSNANPWYWNGNQGGGNSLDSFNKQMNSIQGFADNYNSRLSSFSNNDGYALPGGGYGYTGAGYAPTSQSGTGYISSDYGTYDFGSPMGGDSYYTPSYSNLGDLANYGDYSGYGWDE